MTELDHTADLFLAVTMDDMLARERTHPEFTPRQLDVLCELAKAQTNKRIGKVLILSPETVKHHLKAIFLKLRKSTRKDAVAEARRRAVIT